MIRIITNWREVPFTQICDLYESVGWQAYTRDLKALHTAFENSTSVLLAMDEDKLVGLARSVSDKVSIHYLQDILIHPAHQRLGIGRKLLEHALDQYSSVRTHMILTDDEAQKDFYESLGFKNTKNLMSDVLNSYVRMKDIELK